MNVKNDAVNQKVYQFPDIKVIEFNYEGVLCSSSDVDMNPEEGYM